METLYDELLLPRLLFSLVAFMISAGPIFADFNKTHATNPLWTPHARFHVVWQVLSQTGISLVILYLLWSPAADYLTHIWVAAILNYVWGASFYATLATMPIYGGALKDTNGIKPFRFNIFGTVYLVDTNLFGGTILMIVNTIGVWLLVN
ncbi:hypothetical protein Plav_0129 [Parvibaculum lavamentivorans DS-1]|uniref:Uncharacterized protein n=1 Tax=Parvibaculum lavamentivorans (strain DS-1 / DSM 13023 / NCIMB 13966) TaxID=402881 RepID=A7HPB9_PARL1|nr:DUF6640 family protein [Parvibaculum lavamentivorans]ABS61752.1 hypothetical protein Plav_0129 [Parvibaculum lavamentivorans DS-1]